MLRTLALAAAAVLSANVVGLACGGNDSDCIVQTALTVQQRRERGPAGLAAALAQYDALVERLAALDRQGASGGEPDPALARARAEAAQECVAMQSTVDRAAGQRGATVSRLYWYADLTAAQEEAALSGKPILSLRMLGKLTDEYSCANSRFFRTALYSNKEIGDYLREHYILHWQSVRPVPRVTIDFGDGRKLQRTVTGNSAHYVLDAAGRPLDVLPGLYGPQAFLDWLRRSHDFSQRLANVADQQRGAWLASYHGERLQAVEESLRNDLGRFAPELLQAPNAVEAPAANRPKAFPTAIEAGERAVAKSKAEAPLIAPFMPDEETLQAQGDDVWRKIAAARAAESKLDDASVNVMRRERPAALAAGAVATTKRLVEDPILRIVRNFEEAMALDSVKNEYLLHRRIHRWYVEGEAPADFDALNERVYAELFLTPSSDPWLGLAPAGVYTALDSGGLTAGK